MSELKLAMDFNNESSGVKFDWPRQIGSFRD